METVDLLKLACDARDRASQVLRELEPVTNVGALKTLEARDLVERLRRVRRITDAIVKTLDQIGG